MKKKIIGIDLGTTNSCVAYFEKGSAKVIKNRSGERTTPSVVTFDTDGTVKVGSFAKRQLLVNPNRTVYSVKRIMGTKQKIKILNKEYSPEDISAYILMELKRQASDYLGYEVTEAVITVPAYFTEVQRQATKDAGKIAGLNVLRLINEPTAAALSYKLNDSRKETVLVYDLGGGTFDVSILKIENGIFEVAATSGDRNLGGDDFDNEIFNWAVKNIKQESIDTSKPETLQRIRLESERVKKELSFSESVSFELPFLTSSFSFSRQITRVFFENLTRNLLNKTKVIVERALSDAKLSTSDISSVLLVGGSTRMPSVANLIKNMFNRDPIISIDPDESVALGAAVQGNILQGDSDSKDIVLMDVTPLSLGIEDSGVLMSVIIPRNTTIPNKREQIYTNAVDNQPSATIRVFQGERKLTADNEFLGEFDIELKPSRKGEQRIKVIFDLDVNGILKVTAFDEVLGKPKDISIVRNNLSKEDIESKVKQAEEFKEKDEQETKKVSLFNVLENIRYTINYLKNNKNCSSEDINRVNEIEGDIDKSGWHKKDDFDVASFDDIEKKLNGFDRELLTIKIRVDKPEEPKVDDSEQNSTSANKGSENNDESDSFDSSSNKPQTSEA